MQDTILEQLSNICSEKNTYIYKTNLIKLILQNRDITYKVRYIMSILLFMHDNMFRFLANVQSFIPCLFYKVKVHVLRRSINAVLKTPSKRNLCVLDWCICLGN